MVIAMNKQRKVLITITYNEMGIIVDTKAEEVAQPSAKDTNIPITDTISRQAAIDVVLGVVPYDEYWKEQIEKAVNALPSAQPTVDAVPVIRCKDCKHWDGVDTCDVIDAPVWDDDFCSMAERKEHE